ncbi:MazG nucleotide pyrophosphohydrolase domain-containing protein [Paenarthrobacter nicotinovorans]|uniref:MazG nucleotide pyrophosphohydrolase domain-containing protein n=1 Tax=Paenarthrobacter nicotinovorans TaxID=29320 RepID=UPI0039A6968A
MNTLIALQKDFDSKRQTKFDWAAPITEESYSSLTHNALALAGEVGELANEIKKFDRGDFSFDQLLDRMPSELADVLIYVIKIAYQSDIDLEKAFLEKLEHNKRRFPRSVVPESGKVTMESFPGFDAIKRFATNGLAESIDVWSERAAAASDVESLARLDSLAAECSVRLPADSRHKYAVALIVGVFVEAGSLEGRPEARDAFWRKLEPVAAAQGFGRREIAALTAEGDAIAGEVVAVLATAEIEANSNGE